MIDFMQNLQTEEHNFQETFETTKHAENRGLRGIPTSNDLTGIEVRLSNVTVIDNKTPKVFPFPGLATVYFINIVASDVSADSVTLDINGFEKVDDNSKLAIDRVLFMWKKSNDDSPVPSQIHIFSSLVKSKKPLRDVGKIMSEVKDDNNFKNAVSTLSSVIKTASNLTNISTLILQTAGIVGNFLGKVDDKPLLTWVQSFTDINGDFDPLGKTDKNAKNKFASMDLSITVRDTDRTTHK